MRKFIIFIVFLLLLISFVKVKVFGKEEKKFAQGWNYLTFDDEDQKGASFADLPENCLYVVYQKDSWFYSFVRGYSEPEDFVLGQQYYIFCSQEASW